MRWSGTRTTAACGWVGKARFSGWLSWGLMPWCRSAGWARWTCGAWLLKTTHRFGSSTPLLRNAHAAFVLREAAAAIERYRAEGKTVLLHCVRAESRTPTVAALYGAHAARISQLEALEDVRRALPNARPNPLFMKVLAAAETGTDPAAGGATHAGAQ
jgi:hypothetical protein